MSSIRARLTTPSVLLALALFLLLWLGQSWFLRDLSHDLVSQRLEDESYLILKALAPGESGQWQLDSRYLSAAYMQPMSGLYYQYRVGDGPWHYSRSLWDGDIPRPDRPPPAGAPVSQRIDRNGKPWVVRDAVFEKHGQPIRILVAEDISRLAARLGRLSALTLGLGLLLLLALLGAMLLIVRAGLAELDKVAANIARLKEGEIRQLPDSTVRELHPLVSEINYLVQSMEVRLERSRNAVGNLAHAAKTPLTIMDRQIERLRGERPECAAALAEQSAQMREMIERELARARICGSALPGQRIRIGQELDRLRRTMAAMYGDKGLEIEIRVADELRFPGERDDLMELLGNLLDNACKWASGRVRVRGEISDQTLSLAIEDDGPGVAPAQRQRLLARGTRLDERKSGHGLGLSIVSEIVAQYRGTVELSESELGGLSVLVRLPV